MGRRGKGERPFLTPGSRSVYKFLRLAPAYQPPGGLEPPGGYHRGLPFSANGPLGPDQGHTFSANGPLGPDQGHTFSTNGPLGPDQGHTFSTNGPLGPDQGHTFSANGPLGPDQGHTFFANGPLGPDQGHTFSTIRPLGPDQGHVFPDDRPLGGYRTPANRNLVRARRRGRRSKETKDLISAPSRPTDGLKRARQAGDKVLVNGKDYARLSRPYKTSVFRIADRALIFSKS